MVSVSFCRLFWSGQEEGRTCAPYWKAGDGTRFLGNQTRTDNETQSPSRAQVRVCEICFLTT